METNGTNRLVGDSYARFSLVAEGLAESTKSQYDFYLAKFLDWLEMDTEEFKKKAEESLRSERSEDRLWVGHQLAKYQIYMRDELGYSISVRRGRRVEVYPTSTTTVPISATITFLRSNGLVGIPLNGILPVKVDSVPLVEKSQLIQIVDRTGSIRNKAIIYTMRDTGLRVGDVTNLAISDIKPALDDPSVEWYTFTIEQEKTETPADPCLGPESLYWIREWMKFREEKGIPAEYNDPLFCIVRAVKGHSRSDAEGVRGSTLGGWLRGSNISMMFSDLVKKAGLKEDEYGEPTRISAHSVRKYHTTYGTLGRIPERWLNVMQGKAGEGTQGVYQKPNEEMLLEAFKKGYSALSFETTEPSGVTKKLAELTDEVEHNRLWAGVFQEEKEKLAKENAELKARLDKLEKMMEEAFSS